MSRKTRRPLAIGILAFHGDVAEHEDALVRAAQKLKLSVSVREVRTKEDLKGLSGLVIPGGESPTLEKLLKRAGMFSELTKLKGIFGTCAGAILLSTRTENSAKGQETLRIMDIAVDRNAYGRQTDSHEADVTTALGLVRAVFIRAPKITSVGKSVAVLGTEAEGGIVACEERKHGKYYLATAFHPELTTTRFHEHFLRNLR